MTFFLSVNGLFDFDLTFLLQALLFATFSVIVNFAFLSPLSKELEERSAYLDYSQKLAVIKLSTAQEKLSTYIEILLDDAQESTRQLKNLKNYSTKKFDAHLSTTQKNSIELISEVKGKTIVASGKSFSFLLKEIDGLTQKFFSSKFFLS